MRSSEYPIDLFDILFRSDEFSETNVIVESVPDDDTGTEFFDQFMGGRTVAPSKQTVTSKNARTVVRWGSEIRANIRLADPMSD